ncbi:MAG: M20 family metallopeptidase, partial [Dehalococcoidia bacterium]
EFLEYSRGHVGEIIDTLDQLVQRESFTADKPAVDELGRWIRRQLDGLGATTEVIPQSSVGDHILAGLGDGPEQVLILCHFDTVWPPGTASRKPFRVEGGMAFGPGVLDMKAGIAITLHALRLLQELDVQPKRRVRMVFNTDEETDSATSREVIEREAGKSAHVFCLEPGFGKQGALKTARKGVGAFDVKITGRAAHAGNDPENGISATEEMAYQVLRLKELNDPSTGTTVTVGAARAGTVRNQVAPYAEALVDIRVVTPEEGERVSQAILGLTPVLPGAKLEVTGGMERPPMERTEAMVQLFERASGIALGLDVELKEASVGGGSDAQFAAALGVPVLDGLGGVGEGPHAETEYIFVDSLPQRTALLASLLVEL